MFDTSSFITWEGIFRILVIVFFICNKLSVLYVLLIIVGLIFWCIFVIFQQKLLIGGTSIGAAFFIVPGYILYNIKYYNGSAYKTPEEDDEEDE